jgi:uncharacterized protein
MKTAKWLLLLPPSEGKAAPPANASHYATVIKRKKDNAFPELDKYRQLVIDVLQDAIHRNHGLDKLFEVSGHTLEHAIEANLAINKSPTLTARELYTGVLYEAINYKTLKAGEKKLFDHHTIIFSGMFGLIRPTDLLPDYKLKIGANLGGTVGKLIQYWRAPVSEILRHEVRGKVVWDFLPDQHRRLWDGTGEMVGRHQVKFVKRVIRSGVAEYKTISHHSKALKGALVRHLLATNATNPEDLQDFIHPDGYVFHRELSVISDRDSTLVFAAD